MIQCCKYHSIIKIMTYLQTAREGLYAAVSGLYEGDFGSCQKFVCNYGLRLALTAYAAYQLYQNPMKFYDSTRVLCAIGLSGIATECLGESFVISRASSNTATCASVIGSALCATYFPQYYCTQVPVFAYHAVATWGFLFNKMIDEQKVSVEEVRSFVHFLPYGAGAVLLNCKLANMLLSHYDIGNYINPNIAVEAAIVVYHTLVSVLCPVDKPQDRSKK